MANGKSACRPSKNSRLFAELHGLSSGNPKTFTDDQLVQFDLFKDEQRTKYQQNHYRKRVENGTAPQHTPREMLTPEDLEHKREKGSNDSSKMYAVKTALRCAAQRLGLDVFDENIRPLRRLLKTKLMDDEIKAIENEAIEYLKKNPKKRKAADENGHRRPGPARNKNGDQDPETMRVNSMNSESSGRDYAKIKALREEAGKYVMMIKPINDYNLSTLRNILSQYITKNEIDEIETRAVQEYDKSIEDKKVPRMEPVSRSLELLDQFFTKYPDVTRVDKVGLLAPDHHSLYLRFLRSLDPERFRQRDREYENRPEIKAARKESRKLSVPHYFRELVKTSQKQVVPMEITEGDIDNMVFDPCFYCDETFPGPGIDALDIKSGFVLDNIRSCCTSCNMAKHNHEWRDFVRIMCNIGAKVSNDQSWNFNYNLENLTKYAKSSKYSGYSRRAEKKGLDFEICIEDFDALTSQPCEYCGYSKKGHIGLDRIDSKGHYTIDNVVPCCTVCNYAKHKFDVDDFIDKAKKIYKNWQTRMA